MARGQRLSTAVVVSPPSGAGEEELATAAPVALPSPPWSRMPGESSRAFLSFTTYRDLPARNRTVRMVQDILYPDSQWAEKTIRSWSKKYHWAERVRLWENEKDRQRLLIEAETIRTMTARHTAMAIALQDAGLEALQRVLDGEITVADARLLITEGAKLERLSRGQATEKHDTTHRTGLPDELRNLPEEELRRLAGVAQRIIAGARSEEPE